MSWERSGAWNEGLATTSSPAFVTVKLSGLTGGYFPYHVSNATGLANSPIYTDGTNVGIGTTAPGAKLDVNGNTYLGGVGGTAAGYKVNIKSAGASDGATFQILPASDTDGMSNPILQMFENGAGIGAMNLLNGGIVKVKLTAGTGDSYINAGNVGIGTTGPLSLLSINGGVHIGGDSDAGDDNLLVDGTGTIIGAFGCNGTTAQTGYANAPWDEPGAGAFGADSAGHFAALVELVQDMQAALVANGILATPA